MEKIASFQVDHTVLLPGMYVSRVDGDVTTFDLRFVRPNTPPYLSMPAVLTLERLFATFARNSEHKDKVIYFGPMGCRTGCYLLLFGEWQSADIYDTVVATCDFILAYEGDIPGAAPEQCGNYSEQNLNMAKFYIQKYRDALVTHKRFSYPTQEDET